MKLLILLEVHHKTGADWKNTARLITAQSAAQVRTYGEGIYECICDVEINVISGGEKTRTIREDMKRRSRVKSQRI